MSAVIEDFVVPDVLQEGSPVTVRILMRNTGPLGYLDYFIDANPTSPTRFIMVESGRTPTPIPTGSTLWVDVPFRYFPMPAWDYTLIASNESGTSSLNRTILLGFEGDIPTSLTISASGSVPQEELFNIVGLLLRTDINAPVPGAMINVSYNGIVLGNVFTDDLGRYLIATSIEASGIYTLKARFAGSSTLGASTSTIKTTIGTSPIIPIVIGVGAILYLISRK